MIICSNLRGDCVIPMLISNMQAGMSILVPEAAAGFLLLIRSILKLAAHHFECFRQITCTDDCKFTYMIHLIVTNICGTRYCLKIVSKRQSHPALYVSSYPFVLVFTDLIAGSFQPIAM